MSVSLYVAVSLPICMYIGSLVYLSVSHVWGYSFAGDGSYIKNIQNSNLKGGVLHRRNQCGRLA